VSDDTTGALGLGALGMLLFFYLGAIAFSVYIYVRIARKAGYSGWWAAVLFVPVANLVVMVMFAFVEWPIERELKTVRAARAGAFGAQGIAALGSGGSGGFAQGQFGQSQFGQVSAPRSQFGQISPPTGQFAPPAASQSGYGPDPLPSQPVFGRPDAPGAPGAAEQRDQKPDEPPSPYGAH
jgi:hypothetical protein